jgi:hypothetical protein
MSFTTNNNTRRTKRARTHGIAADTSGAVAGSSGLSQFAHNPSISSTARKPTLVETVIGSHSSKGLTIMGGSANDDFHHGTNPDGRSIALGTSGEDDGLTDGFPNSNLAHPPFPISYQGNGYMRFMNPISIPTIIHPVHIKGDTTFGGDVTIAGSLFVVSPPITFVPVIQDALGNELTGATSDSVYLSDSGVDYFELTITWTGVGSLDPAEEMRLTGLPLTNYSATSEPDMTGHGGVATTAIGGQFHTLIVPGQSYIVLQEVDQSAGTASTALLGANFYAAGEIRIRGHLRKT